MATTLDEFDNDLQCLKSVAEKRDKSAFAQLYQRHEPAAYNLAFYITRNQADAQEALQDALVRTWKSAEKFREEGSVRGWLLRIVARESLRKIHQRRKDAEVKKDFAETESASASPDTAIEKGELIDALRKQLELLPQVDRELLALHFGGGLSQDEIGSTMQYSQQAVSIRIKKSLNHLRTKLALAGMAGAVPMLDAELLGNAFHGGHSIPQNLAGMMLGHLNATVKESVRHAGKMGPASNLVANSLIAITALSAAVAASVYYFAGESAPAVEAPRAAAPRIEAPRAEAPRVEAKRSESAPMREYVLTLQEGQPIRELGLAPYVGTRDASIYFSESKHNPTPTLYVWQGWYTLIGFAVFAKEGGPLPDQAEIMEAKLAVLELDDTTLEELGLFRILSPWKPAEVSWDFSANKVKWKAPGGDLAENPAALSKSPGKKKVWCEFDVTESLAQAKQEGKNYGWALTSWKDGKCNRWAGGWMQFAPSSYTDDPSARPKLILKVRCPELRRF